MAPSVEGRGTSVKGQFVLYHYTHSLVVAALFVILLGTIRRPLALPALAWPAHILIDSLLHGAGRWETPMFIPLSDWHYHGVNWWHRHDVVLIYWSLLPALWLTLVLWRRRARARAGRQGPTATPGKN